MALWRPYGGGALFFVERGSPVHNTCARKQVTQSPSITLVEHAANSDLQGHLADKKAPPLRTAIKEPQA